MMPSQLVRVWNLWIRTLTDYALERIKSSWTSWFLRLHIFTQCWTLVSPQHHLQKLSILIVSFLTLSQINHTHKCEYSEDSSLDSNLLSVGFPWSFNTFTKLRHGDFCTNSQHWFLLVTLTSSYQKFGDSLFYISRKSSHDQVHCQLFFPQLLMQIQMSKFILEFLLLGNFIIEFQVFFVLHIQYLMKLH